MERLDPNTIIENLIGSNRVVVFSKSTCPFCIQVKKLFNQENIEYVVLELDIEKGGKAIMNALIEKTGHKTVPNVFISGKHIGGCDDLLRLFETGALNAMCPPKAHGFEYDLVVIGGGSGGLAAAKEASLMGKRVAVCDFVVPSPVGTTWGLGGTCVNVGCIPKKLMHQAALLGTAVRDAAAFGWAVPEKVEHDWEKMAKAIQNHVRSLNFGYRVALKEKNVIYFNSYAQFVTANKIKLTNKKGAVQEVTSDQFIIAVGGRPAYPPNTPGAREFGITSDDLFWLSKSPGKTLLVGASYIALECAGFLAGLGLDVTVMVRSILLRGFDSQMAEMIGEYMKSHGVKFIEECVPNSIEQVSAGPPQLLKVKATKNDKSLYEEEFNTVIFAVGRTACTSGVGLEEIGVKLHNNGKIIADSGEQSSVKNIYAIGDVLYGRPELTPVAIQAGKLLVRRLFADAGVLTDYANVPTTVFTPLEYGCVGMTEEAAKHKYGYANIEVYHSHFKPLEATLPGRADRDKGYAKIICVKLERERVVGLHVLGPNAGEITQGFAMGVKMHAKKMDFEALVGIHPTCAEIFTTLTVTKASGESIDKTSC